jgi:hypothetical protein
LHEENDAAGLAQVMNTDLSNAHVLNAMQCVHKVASKRTSHSHPYTTSSALPLNQAILPPSNLAP